MKSIIISTIFISILGVACTKTFDATNSSPNDLENVGAAHPLNPIIYGATSFNMQRAEDWTFPIMQVALSYPASGGVQSYEITESAGNSTWNTYYRWLNNIKEMRNAAKFAQDPNYEAVAMTLNAWILSLLTDCFGDVPYEEALKAEENVLKPKFDSQKDIYTKLLADLEEANKKFATNREMIYIEDILFRNKVYAWKRFCNSLQLRLLLRISKRGEMNSFTKMAEMFGDPVKYPVFISNDTSAVLRITGLPPNISPWGRPQDFTTGTAMASFMLDSLNKVSDPRRARWSTQARAIPGNNTIGYKGIPAGYPANTVFDYTPSNKIQGLVATPMIAPILTYSEVEFMRAELIQRGYLAGDAKTAYENGVKANMTLWGATVPATYFNNASAAYDGTLERIMLQKYYALFFTDYQQWFEYRRTGLPVLPTQDGMQNNKKVPVRFQYPVSVKVQNPTNYQKAKEAMGGDDINVKVWWEK